MPEERISMSQRERERWKVLEEMEQGHLTQVEGARRLRLSPRQLRRIERLFKTLQDRLVKELRLAEVRSLEHANRFLEITFLPEWEKRFARLPRHPQDAHRRLGGEHRLEQILSVRQPRSVSPDHTVSWHRERWGVPREAVCAGLRGARAEIERRLDGTHWLRFRGRYLPLRPCPVARPVAASPSGLRPPGLAAHPQPKGKHTPSPNHPGRKSWKRTFLRCVDIAFIGGRPEGTDARGSPRRAATAQRAASFDFTAELVDIRGKLP
jgi:hypothetical protein